MVKKLSNLTISFNIEELLESIDIEKVQFINDASHNLQTSTDQYGIAPFSRHIFKEHLPQEVVSFVDGLGFKNYGCNLLIQHPGECSPLHYDLFLYQQEVNNNTSRDDYFRFIIFLKDRVIGQFYHIEDKQLDWKKGDMLYQDTKEYHCGGNISNETRYTLIIDTSKEMSPYGNS